MSAIDYAVIGAVGAALFFACRAFARRRKNGGGCHGASCGDCPGCAGRRADTPPKRG